MINLALGNRTFPHAFKSIKKNFFGINEISCSDKTDLFPTKAVRKIQFDNSASLIPETEDS